MNSNRGAIVIDGPTAQIYSPFAAKDAIKTIPGRRWDKARKCWTVPAAYAVDAERVLWRYCSHVDVRDSRPSSPPPPTVRGNNPFGPMFDAVPDRLRRKAFRALAAVLHGDHDGDDEPMKLLNLAAEEALR